MKLLNIFKKQKVKDTKKIITSNISALDKTQLEKVIGGGAPLKGVDIKLG